MIVFSSSLCSLLCVPSLITTAIFVSQYSLGSTTVFVFENVVLCRIDKLSLCHYELVDGRLLRVEGEVAVMF